MFFIQGRHAVSNASQQTGQFYSLSRFGSSKAEEEQIRAAPEISHTAQDSLRPYSGDDTIFHHRCETKIK
jgi:hypothetical protein